MKKTVLGSILALAVSIALLAGATFAWFTDSIANSGNTITAGELKINAYAYDYDAAGAGNYVIEGVNGDNALNFETEGQDLRTNGAAIIQETNWEPGASNAKLLKVENAGTLAAKVKLDFTTSGELTDALWFDFIQVNVNDDPIAGTFTERPMNTLAELAEKTELTIKTGANVQFILVYGMNEDAGNNYQGAEFAVDVAILAKQAAVEEDGFGNPDYDANAEYFVSASSYSDLKKAISEGTNVILTKDVSVISPLEVNDDIVIDLNGNDLKGFSTSRGVVDIGGGNVTIRNGGILANRNVASSSALYAYGDANVLIENCTITTPYSNTYAVVTNGAKSINTVLVIRNSTISGLGESGKGYSGYFPSGNITLENCNVTGHIFISGGNVTIDGGEYTATGFRNQSKIYHESETAEYAKTVGGGYACNMGDSILIFDRRDGYSLESVTVKNVVFNTEIELDKVGKAIAYAIKYVDRNELPGVERAVFTIENNTYNHQIEGEDPVMKIDLNGTSIG